MSLTSDDRTNTVTATSEPDTAEHSSTPASDSQSSKRADLAGPGIGDYAELRKFSPATTTRF